MPRRTVASTAAYGHLARRINAAHLKDRTSVIGAIAPQLERAEIARAQRKPTENLNAYDYYLRGLAKIGTACVTRHFSTLAGSGAYDAGSVRSALTAALIIATISSLAAPSSG